jgi:hypothetical protein
MKTDVLRAARSASTISLVAAMAPKYDDPGVSFQVSVMLANMFLEVHK